MDRIDRSDYDSEDPANFQKGRDFGVIRKTLASRCAFASVEYDAEERIVLCSLGKGTRQCFFINQPKCPNYKSA